MLVDFGKGYDGVEDNIGFVKGFENKCRLLFYKSADFSIIINEEIKTFRLLETYAKATYLLIFFLCCRGHVGLVLR